MRNSFYFVVRDAGVIPVHQSVDSLSGVVEHGSVVDIDPFLVALRARRGWVSSVFFLELSVILLTLRSRCSPPVASCQMCLL